MANKTGKPGRLGLRLPKQWMKYMILLTGAVMLLSGLYTGVERDPPQDAATDLRSKWNVVQYDSASLGQSSALVNIMGPTGQYMLRPNAMSRLSEQDITDVFESNVTGVKSIVLENAPGEEFFHLETDGSDVSAEVARRIRMPGGYKIYGLYLGTTPYGNINIVGDGLAAGDWVRVILLERLRGGASDTLGFVEKKIPSGPTYDAVVTGFGSGDDNSTAYVRLPEDVVFDGSVVQLPDGGSVRATLPTGVKANDTVKVKLSSITLSNITVYFATAT